MFKQVNKLNFILVICFSFLLIFGACLKDDGEGNQDEGAETQYLSGTTDAPMTLENIYEDPQRIDYFVDGNWSIDAAVTVEPGVRIVMKSGMRIIIKAEGSLDASGTASKKIYFIGEQDVEGYWDYIRFDNSNNLNNRLIHTVISNGGGYQHTEAAVFLDGSSRLIMQNSEVTKSARFGLFVDDTDARLDDFENNTFTECGQHPIHLDALHQTDYMDANTDFSTGNTYNTISVDGATSSQPFTVRKVSGAYKLNGYSNIESDVVIEAGTEILMGAGARITVKSGASLKAIGSANNRINISGDQQSKGYWDYILFDNSNNTNNEFQYVDVSYGGGYQHREGAIYLDGSSLFKMGNSSVNYSARNGIHVESNADFDDSDGNNGFTGNDGDDIHYE
ncbi:MAG: hypothetical protein WD334_10490 [Chitinophagales bacterium]